MSTKSAILPFAIGAAVAVALGFTLAAPWSALLVIAGYGAAIGGLIGLQARHWVPFKFKSFVPADPLPQVYDDSIARENGSALSRTPLARVFAVLMGVALIALFVLLISAMGDTSWVGGVKPGVPVAP